MLQWTREGREPHEGQLGPCFPEVRLELDPQDGSELAKQGGGRNGVKPGPGSIRFIPEMGMCNMHTRAEDSM